MTKKLSNVNIYKFRVIIDTEQDVFRDVEIETDATFERLHEAILDAFDFEAGEMASFYMSNEQWEKGLEIPLMDMAGDAALSMKSTKLSDMVSKPSEKVLYVYDFMRMWIFYVELMEVKKDKPSTIYPRVALAFGDAPSQDSKEMDLFGSEFSEEEFNEMHGDVNDDKEEDDDMFDADEEYFDESEFNGSYGSYDEN
ncbi:MAG: IS1096 element passenger TnpR family protein [Flavobacteriales bacterium]